MAKDFAAHVQEERDRLHEKLGALQMQQNELQGEMDKINAELRALDAYEAAKEGKVVPKRTRSTGSRRSGIREQVLATITAATGGINRADILERMGVKGDKAAEQSVSNALAHAKKQGKVTLDDGIYKVAGG